jgi:para-nitrobenzyl esterase
MKKIYLLGLVVTSVFFAQAQQDCSNGRYVDELFPTITTTSNIQYGSNLDLNGGNVNLLLDVYQPTGDAETNRPVIIFIHGGSFVGGSKTGTDVVPLAQEFAKKGYVTASINYRLGISLTGNLEKNASEAVMRATQDSRAAVRFFRKSVDTEGNPYGIDDTQIYIAGVSAGGFNALHLAYLDEVSEIPAIIDLNAPGLSGEIEGDSGNPGYLSTVNAIVNLAGALADTSWMQAGDTPILSFHGDADGTVPYGTDLIYLGGVFPIMIVDGSSTVHERAENLGLTHCFKPHYGAGHVPHTSNANYYDTTVTYMTQWLKTFVCGGTDYCYDYATMSLAENSSYNVSIYPNPASTKLTIESDGTMSSVRIIDFSGRLVKEVATLNTTFLHIDVSSFPEGIYFVESNFSNGSRTISKVVIR